jgi:late competence protein required for DNA uptake (superfamily II DNA/RNA helicase)
MKKDKESWKCEVCSTEAKKEDDKMVQCEWCSKYYCIVCLQISVSDYESFSNTTLRFTDSSISLLLVLCAALAFAPAIAVDIRSST